MPLLVNGVQHDPEVGPEWTLLRVLRERLGLTAAKPGCGEGVCGACTVLVGGQPARSCVTTLAEVGARPVVTLEGLAPAGMLHPLQQAFLELSAFQCGYCTPGMIVSAAALLAADPDPDDDAIVSALQGNVCRCCAYPRILRAVGRAAELGPQPVPAPAAPQEQAFERPAQPWDLVSNGERDWFAVLPDGLVAVAEAGSGRWTTSAGAWVHVGAGGAVTAFTGKVDVGQGNSTALAVLVAAELGLEPDAVRVVMGDTDLCPYDEGTFGSRSMADAGPLLRVAAAAARRSLAERPLGEGERRVEVASRGVTQLPAAPAAAARRQGGLGIVTGSVRFPGDLSRPAMLHGSAAKPPSPDARLQSVDEAAAGAVPGATVVREESFVGVAARDRETLDRAVQALSVEWGPPAGPDEGELEAYLRSHPAEAEGWMAALDEEVGDVRRALAEAPVRLEATYRTAYVAHVPLETRAAVAEWDGGRLTVWTGTQRPFGVRAELAEELSLAEEQVRVIAPTAGAGFGGKHRGEAAIEAARLARAAGRPVKVHWTRAEEFAAAYLRPAAVIDVRSGARSDGTLAAWEFVNVGSGAAGIASPYPVPNRRLVFQPAESPLRQGSYRALAATANHFARESHLDELAHEVGADPLELRLRQLEDDRLADVLRAAADRAGWDERGAALGIACGVEKDARVATCAEVRVDGDGAIRATRIVTAFDCGAIVDPDNLENQIQGATVMGLGGALFERIRFARGRLLTQSLAEYRVPRFGDVPAIEVVLLDRRDVAPAGAGETPIVCVAPAIANALHAATGERRRSLPLLDPA
ncbi:MAG TPA: molybdopterin cofactor-binding domain-containing protein [Gaiellaceae bacterium]|nr:molybdopterin cofactor-binding domain-containing protein [Gaiellaceae bacterium]